MDQHGSVVRFEKKLLELQRVDARVRSRADESRNKLEKMHARIVVVVGCGLNEAIQWQSRPVLQIGRNPIDPWGSFWNATVDLLQQRTNLPEALFRKGRKVKAEVEIALLFILRQLSKPLLQRGLALSRWHPSRQAVQLDLAGKLVFWLHKDAIPQRIRFPFRYVDPRVEDPDGEITTARSGLHFCRFN